MQLKWLSHVSLETTLLKSNLNLVAVTHDVQKRFFSPFWPVLFNLLLCFQYYVAKLILGTSEIHNNSKAFFFLKTFQLRVFFFLCFGFIFDVLTTLFLHAIYSF